MRRACQEAGKDGSGEKRESAPAASLADSTRRERALLEYDGTPRADEPDDGAR